MITMIVFITWSTSYGISIIDVFFKFDFTLCWLSSYSSPIRSKSPLLMIFTGDPVSMISVASVSFLFTTTAISWYSVLNTLPSRSVLILYFVFRSFYSYVYITNNRVLFVLRVGVMLRDIIIESSLSNCIHVVLLLLTGLCTRMFCCAFLRLYLCLSTFFVFSSTLGVETFLFLQYLDMCSFCWQLYHVQLY